MTEPTFEYDRDLPLDIRVVGTLQDDGFSSSDLTYISPVGGRRAAELFLPHGDGPFPAILYVHWLAETPNANRSQFVEEAKRMAKVGAAALLIETQWSDRDWFIKRSQAEDYDNSIRQVIDLCRAMDVLLAQPGIDAGRLAYVGHDFGAMYGVLMGSVDPRPCCYALMAGTPTFPDWYLYYPKLEGAQRAAFIENMAPLDPVNRVAALAPAPVLFQFARHDFHVSEERALRFYQAADEPKEIRWYEAEHELNQEATEERIAWVRDQLRLENR